MTTDQGFLASPGELADWRMVLLWANAAKIGLLDVLPATAQSAARTLGLHPKSTRILLDALTVFDIVTTDTDTGAVNVGENSDTVGDTDTDTDVVYHRGPAAPDETQEAMLAQHAQFIGRWAAELPGRLPDPVNHERRPWNRDGLAAWLEALGARARQEAPTIIDQCLAEFPEARTVLDVAGGHGEYGLEAARRGLEVTLVDLPQVIDVVSGWSSVAGSELTLVPGDIFEGGIEETFDLVLCFGFTHTQPATRTATVFGLLADLINPGGGLAITTFLRGASPVSSLFAVQMLISGNDGDTYSPQQYRSWLRNAGFGEPTFSDHDGRTLLTTPKFGRI